MSSVWDVFTGKKKQKEPAPSEFVSESSPPTAYTPTVYQPVATDANSFLGAASLPDASQLHPLAGLNQQTLDYLSLDESALSELPGGQSILPSRGWSDDLCYGTGTVYLAALSAGGAWGLVEGLNRVPASAPPKLRLNSVLNTVTRRGPFLGNSAGVVAMTYNGINSTIGYYRGRHDAGNSVAAGALSGMIFRSTKGTKQMMISGAVVASIAGAWAVSLLCRQSSNVTDNYRSHERSSLSLPSRSQNLYEPPQPFLWPPNSKFYNLNALYSSSPSVSTHITNLRVYKTKDCVKRCCRRLESSLTGGSCIAMSMVCTAFTELSEVTGW